MRLALAMTCVAILFSACDPSYERFDSAEEIRDVLVGSGMPCDSYIDEMTKHGPPIPNASWGQCDTEDRYASFMVFDDQDALSWLQRAEGRTQDDTPRQYWVYGENWFVGTNTPALQAEIHDALGGGIAANTDF